MLEDIIQILMQRDAYSLGTVLTLRKPDILIPQCNLRIEQSMPCAYHVEIPKYADEFFLVPVEFQHGVYLEQCVVEVASGKFVQSAIDEHEARLKQPHQICLDHSSHPRPSLHLTHLHPQFFDADICRLFLEVELLDEFPESAEEC